MSETIQKNGTRRVQIAASEYRGKEYLDVREYYEADDGEWRPTKKGVTIPPDSVPAFIEAVTREAARKGWAG
jgi:hypothetical protein